MYLCTDNYFHVNSICTFQCNVATIVDICIYPILNMSSCIDNPQQADRLLSPFVCFLNFQCRVFCRRKIVYTIHQTDDTRIILCRRICDLFKYLIKTISCLPGGQLHCVNGVLQQSLAQIAVSQFCKHNLPLRIHGH